MSMFTCVACGTEATQPRRLREGLVCSSCARFLLRAEDSFEESALLEAEVRLRIGRVAA